MAKADSAASEAIVIDDEAHYRVTLSRAVQVKRTWLRPRDDLTVKGRVLKEIVDDVTDFHPVAL